MKSMKCVQAISVLALTVMLKQATEKGTWVTANGAKVSADELPIGITEHDGIAEENITVTVIGTASMNLDGIATVGVSVGDVICYEGGSMIVKSASDGASDPDGVRGIVLSESSAKGHAEVLLR